VSSGPEYLVLLEKVVSCAKNLGIEYSEIHVYPLSRGYRVELYPEPPTGYLEDLAKCIEEAAKLKASIAVRASGKAIFLEKKS